MYGDYNDGNEQETELPAIRLRSSEFDEERLNEIIRSKKNFQKN